MSGLCVAALEIRFWDAVANEPGSGCRPTRNPMDLCTPAGMALLGFLMLGLVVFFGSWRSQISLYRAESSNSPKPRNTLFRRFLQ